MNKSLRTCPIIPDETFPALPNSVHRLVLKIYCGPRSVKIIALPFDWPRELSDFKRRVFSRMKESGLEVREDSIEVSKIFTPHDFQKTFGTYHGNGFGLAPDFFQSACFRPWSRSKDISNLYHVGASTHPGGGIPMVVTSGKLVAEMIDKYHGSGAKKVSDKQKCCSSLACNAQ